MSEFEKYIEAKYPSRSPKILFQKFEDIDGTLFYGIKEVEDQAEVWNHQQAKIEKLENELSTTKQVLGNVIDMEVAKVDNLKAQLNNMKACYIEKKKEVEGVQGQVSEALEEIQRALNCCESTETACVLGELVKVLRGDND